jgi:hypothetical protein
MADDVVVACRGCGCTEITPCPGGCAWVTPGFCTRCIAAPVALSLELPLVAMLAVHGYLLLALRHRADAGPARELVEDFLEILEDMLLEARVLTAEDLAEVHQVAAAEAPRIILAPG